MFLRFFLFFGLVLLARLQGAVIIAELDSSNIGSATDVDGDHPDWIELRNPDATTATLTGWALSDDPAVPGKWVFPTFTMAANTQQLIFASKKTAKWRVWSAAPRRSWSCTRTSS